MPCIVTERKVSPAGEGHLDRARQCATPGCIKSARCRIEVFPGHAELMCRVHATEQARIYRCALADWPHERVLVAAA